MRIAVCGLGSVWTARAGIPRIGMSQQVYYNSTAVQTAKGLRTCPVLYGVVRIEPATGFNPHLPWRMIGRLFEGTGVRANDIRRQITLHGGARGEPDAYLIALRSCDFGVVSHRGPWKSKGVEVLSFSEAGDTQESLVLMSPYSWVQTGRGVFQIERPLMPQQMRSGVLKEMTR